MPSEPTRIGWARDVGLTLLVILVLVVVLTGVFLFAVAREWADAQTPWFGRAVLAVIVTVAGVKIVRELVTPARSRTRSDVAAAGVVVALALAVLYFGVARPALRDRERDAAFAARIAEQRAQADGLEAAARELPDPATADLVEIRDALGRARDRLAEVPDVDPDAMSLEEFTRYTPKQRGELMTELARTTEAMKVFRDRHAALRAALDRRKDKP